MERVLRCDFLKPEWMRAYCLFKYSNVQNFWSKSEIITKHFLAFSRVIKLNKMYVGPSGHNNFHEVFCAP